MPVRSKRELWSSRRCISFLSFTSFGNNSSSFPLILERRAPLCGFAAMSPVSPYRRRKLRMNNGKLTLISAARGGHRSKCSWTWSEQSGSLFRSTRWDKGFHGCIRSLVDRGDSGHQFLKWVMDCLRWMIQVVLRPQQTQGCVLQKKRFGGWTNFWLAQLLSTVEQGRSAIIGLLTAHDLHLPDSAYGCCLTFRRL